MIIVHHLNNSRSQRILWLLEEMGTPYEIRHYNRDAKTNLAPPELKDVHPLGKSPVIEDADFRLAESGAIVDYLIRRHGAGQLQPDPATRAHEVYLEWLHFAEGSAILPFLLGLYTSRLGDAAAPLQPRIREQAASMIGFFSAELGANDWLVGNSLSGADIMMSFIAEMAVAQGMGTAFPNMQSYVERLQARPAWQAALTRGGVPYNFTLK